MPREVRRCLIIDAQPTVRLGVRNLLANRYEVTEASDWSTGVEMVTQVEDFDVAIVDMSRNNGVTAIDGDDSPVAPIRALRRARSGLGIVAHGARPHRLAATDALNAGATAYVAKSSEPDELASAVDAAAESERFIDPGARRHTGPRGSTLTRRQRQILQLFADGRATAEVARRLDLSSETVRAHTKGILSRLGARDRAHAVAKALRAGLIV
jgi:DNA-binding NarL/FixJ family response regulator